MVDVLESLSPLVQLYIATRCLAWLLLAAAVLPWVFDPPDSRRSEVMRIAACASVLSLIPYLVGEIVTILAVYRINKLRGGA